MSTDPMTPISDTGAGPDVGGPGGLPEDPGSTTLKRKGGKVRALKN